MPQNKFPILKIRIVTLSLLAVMIVSQACSSDDNGIENGSVAGSELVSVTESLYNGDTFTSFVRYIFDNKQLKKIESTGGRYMLATYHNGLVFKIEEYRHNNLLRSVEYEYDDLGRIIRKKEVPHNQEGQLSIIEKQISYRDGNIEVSLNFLDANNEMKASNSFLLSTNQEGYITTEKSLESGSDKKVVYSSGNPSKFYHSFDDIVFGETTFTYSNERATEAVQFKQYMFGTYWKNNLILDRQFNLDLDNIAVIGDNYLTGYTYLQDDKPGEEANMVAEYDFSTEGRLVKQVNKMNGFGGTSHKIVTTYEYL